MKGVKLVVSLEEALNSNVAIEPSIALELNEVLQNTIRDEHNIEIDFSNIIVVSDYFIMKLIGRLYSFFPYPKVDAAISFINIDKDNRGIVDRARATAREENERNIEYLADNIDIAIFDEFGSYDTWEYREVVEAVRRVFFYERLRVCPSDFLVIGIENPTVNIGDVEQEKWYKMLEEKYPNLTLLNVG